MGVWEKNWRDEGFCELWRTPAAEVVELVPILREHDVRDVLDLGCGVGRHSWLLAREGFDVTGTDDSPTAVEHCRRWLESEGLAATFCICDMCEIPKGSGAFDAILAYNVIYHTTRSKLICTIDNLRAALRPGGLLYATFIDKNNPRYGIGEEVEPGTFVMSTGAEAGVPHHYVDEQELRELLTAFAILDLRTIEQETHLHPDHKTSSKLAVLART